MRKAMLYLSLVVLGVTFAVAGGASAQAAPWIQVSLSNDWVQGQGFLPNASVDVDVNGSVSSVATDDAGRFWFNPGSDLVPGDVVTADDGTTSKSLTLADLTFDSLDPATDVGSGTAAVPDGTVVEVWMDGSNLTTLVTGGVWTVDFMAEAGADVGYRSNGQAALYDDDGDQTMTEQSAPWIQVSLSNDWVQGQGFLPNASVDVDVNGSVSSVATDGTGRFWLNLNSDLVPGDVVTAGDGTTSKSLTLADLTFDSLDSVTDVVSGSGAPNTMTVVNVGSNEEWSSDIMVMSDDTGAWTADFSSVFDVQPGMVASVYQLDDDGDQTLIEGRVPGPPVTEEEIQAAIDQGVAWLAGQQNPDGSWGDWERVAKTGLAVVKFEDYAYEHGYSPFDEDYLYYEQVTGGLDYLFSAAFMSPVGGVAFAAGGHETYSTGIALMAVAASRDPSRVVNGSGSVVDGWTYLDIAQGGVDYFVAAQNPDGAWRYWANPEASDNSNTGYAVLGLRYAEAFGATIPAGMKTALSGWLDLIQDPVNGDPDDGGSQYEVGGGWVNLLKTGNLLFEAAFVGDVASTPRVQDALDYIERHWNDMNSDPGWKGSDWEPPHEQAAYCLMKGLESLAIDRLDLDGDGVAETDWYAEMATAIVWAQQVDGSWPGDNWGDEILATTWALLTLERVVPAYEISIDIKPGSYPNSINLDKKGVTPVAVLTTAEFDATTVDPATVRFGPAAVSPLRWVLEDVDFDGDMDMILHFDALECGFTATDTEGVLTAETFGGREVVGSDSVRILSPKK